MTPVIAPYGTWPSAITAEMVAASTKPLTNPRRDGDALYWLEGDLEAGGRMALVRLAADGTRSVPIPPPFNLRTRVHEYGGGAWCIDRGVVWFSNFADNAVYRCDLDAGTVPRAIVIEQRRRHADFVLDRARGRLLCVREDHDAAGEARTALVSLDANPTDANAATGVVLAEGRDFYAAPRLSPDGRSVAWLCWDHPQMPWDGTELWVADFAIDGTLVNARRLAGGPDESLCQPVWSPDGVLHVVSDRSGWWNLHRVEGDHLVNVCPMDAECGEPAWSFAQSMYGFVDSTTVIAVAIVEGVHRLLRIDTAARTATPIETAYQFLDDVLVDGDFLHAVAASSTSPTQLVTIDLRDGSSRSLATSATVMPDASSLSTPRRIRFAGSDGRVVHAIFYPPYNAAYDAPADESPPLIVQGHGGPTAMTNVGLRLGNHFWTSRGFAILDVDYTGSAGYGRLFRRALRGRWGLADVEDFIRGARHLADEGLVDRDRMAIRGGSASGYTALCAMAFDDTFHAGVSYYGVSDLARLFADTHKFESHYGEFLLGDAAHNAAELTARSPIHHVDAVQAPILFFQGLEDRVVPPSQSEGMVAALAKRGVPVAYLAFEGEGHGFRRFDTLVRIPKAELYFYSHVFGFTPADPLEPIPMDGTPSDAIRPAAPAAPAAHLLRKPYLLFLGDVALKSDAKTAFGLRDWCPDDVVGEWALPGAQVSLGLPYLSPRDAIAGGAASLVIGVAPVGGALPEHWVEALEAALDAGLDVISGLHARLAAHPRLGAAAARSGARIVDIRRFDGILPTGTGIRRSGRRVLTVGTDCALGKKYTALALDRALRARDIDSTFRATGQTGILIAGSGIAVDAVIADFISGAAEMLSPANDPRHWDVVEGQGSLLHPAFAGVSLGLLHGSQPDAIVLCHDPARTSIEGYPHIPIPPLDAVIARYLDAGRLTNADIRCVGISINSSSLDDAAWADYRDDMGRSLDLPVCDPLRGGVDAIADRLVAS